MKIRIDLLAVMSFMFLIGLIVGVSVNLNKTEEFGYILIDPNEEEKVIFQIIIGGNSSLNPAYFLQAYYALPSPEYNFTEKVLHIGLFTYKTDSGEIIPDPNITVNYISIEILAENYFIEIEEFDFFGTQLTIRIEQQLLNCTIQPLTFYKWGILV